MKKLLIFLLFFFSAQSFAGSCPDGSDPVKSVSADGSYFLYNCAVSSDKRIPDNAHASGSSGWACDAFYIKSGSRCIKESNQKVIDIPDNATAMGSSWVCKARYYKKNNACISMPSNSYKRGTSWACESGYNKSFSKCIKATKVIPANAHVSGSSWACNNGFDKAANSCIKVPANAHVSGASWACNNGFNKAANSCIKATKVLPNNAIAVGSSWVCKSGYKKTGSICIKATKVIPENATAMGISWVCKSGYKKSGSICIKATKVIPDNAHASGSSGWACDAFYIKSGSRCIKAIVIPENATAMGSSWVCKARYYKKNNACISMPSNSYKKGTSWACNTGYTKTGNSCKKNIVIPANAHASGSSWACNTGYTKTGNSCKKNIVIPANAHASGSSWACNTGFNKAANSCIKVPANAHVSGSSWACNTGYTKTGNSCENTAELEKKKLEQEKFEEEKRIAEEKIVKKRKEAQTLAQTYFNDLVAFLKTNNKEYDITTIVSLVNLNKALLTKPWNEVLEKNFAKLKVYTDSSKAFLGYHKSKNDERQKVILNELAMANTRLKNIITYLKFYVQNNITLDIAPAVLDQIKIAEGTYEVKRLNEVSKVSTQVEQFISKNNLSKDYQTFVKSLSQSKQEKPDPVVIPANAHASGSSWACNTGYTKTGNSCENTAEIVKKRKEAQTLAQTYFNDLVAFLKTNNKEYDITTIVSLVTSNKAILTESWNEVLEKNFAKLKVYTDSSKAFLGYHKSKNDERQKVILNELAMANTRLKNIITYLKFYVQNNITSDIAQSVLDQIKVAEKGLKMQNSKELSKVSTQLESFITKNNLSRDYQTFKKSLSKTKTKTETETETETPQVTTNNIDATYLVNVDFIKKANKSDYIALVNLTGKAPNALLNLEGRVVFENDNALSCFYQSKNTIKNDLKYYLYDKFPHNEFLVLDKGFECNQNNLFSYDLIFFEKDTLLRESKSYVSSLAAAIANNHLKLFDTVTKEEQNKDFADRKNKVRNITEGLEDEMILGFGSLIIDNDNTTLCTDVENTLGQVSIMNLRLPYKFTRMGYGKSVGNVSFNNVEGTFTNVQRGLCGFIYAGEESLANLLNAFEKSGTKYDILPIWYSKKDVNNEQLRQDNKKQSALINAQKRKEQIDKAKELARLREESDLAALKASGILKAEQQKELRKRYKNVTKAHLQKIEKEAKLLLDNDPENTGEILSLYPSLVSFMEKKLKESWELDKFSIEINDYGLGNYRNRMIETFITDINFTLKNRFLGEYDSSCARVAIIDDKEFDMLREAELGACKPGSLDSYKKKLDFQSSWIVE